MYNEIVCVVVSPFSKAGKEADKNGIANVYLTAIAGKLPNQAQVVAGTVAVKNGLEIGKTLLVMISERESVLLAGNTVPTRQFSHTVLGDVKPMEILGLRKDLGAAIVVDTTNGAQANNGTNGILADNTQAAAIPTLQTSALPAAEVAPIVEPVVQ